MPHSVFMRENCRACHTDEGVASGTRLHFPPETASAEEIDAGGAAALNTGQQVNFKRKFAPNLKGPDSLRILSQAALKHPNRRTIRARMEWLMTTPDRVDEDLLRTAFRHLARCEACRRRVPEASASGPIPSRMAGIVRHYGTRAVYRMQELPHHPIWGKRLVLRR